MQVTARSHGDNVRSLHPVRVLIAASDRRFVRAAVFLLEREAFEIVGACELREAPALAGSTRPHAVVVDGNESVTEAGRTALALEAASLPLHVLVVASGSSPRHAGSLARTSECGSFADVTRELHRLFGT